MPNPLTQIPAKVRFWLYLAYGLVTLVLGGLQAAGVDAIHGVSVVKVLAFLGFIGTVLGFTAASNVSAIPDASVQSYSDPTGPTGVAAGPAADVPTGQPVQPPLAAKFDG
jgi:hypothetical protein